MSADKAQAVLEAAIAWRENRCIGTADQLAAAVDAYTADPEPERDGKDLVFT